MIKSLLSFVCATALLVFGVLFSSHALPWLFSNTVSDFSIASFPDPHAGSFGPNGPAGNEMTSCSASLSNSINTIISNNIPGAPNIIGVRILGDAFQSSNTNSMTLSTQIGGVSTLDVSNYFNRLHLAGISVIPVIGNHDAYDPSSSVIAWTNIFTLNFITNDPWFYGFTVPGDYRSIIYRHAWHGYNFADITYPWLGDTNTGVVSGMTNEAEVESAYNPWTQAIASKMNEMSNYNFTVLAHFLVDSNGTLNTQDLPTYPFIGPGLTAWMDGLESSLNLMDMASGHTRETIFTLTFLTSNDGHSVPVTKFNTQSCNKYGWMQAGITNNGCIQLDTYSPSRSIKITHFWNSDLGRYFTNGELGITRWTTTNEIRIR